jgi:hypothetical protein
MIKWNEASTKRGIVWGIASVIALIGWWFDKDVQPVLAIGAAAASGLGIFLDDKQS